MTTVAEYLEQEGIDELELAERVGAKPHAVRSRLNVPFPKTWARKLALEDELEPAGRESEQTPRPPAGARVVEPAPTADLDYSTIAGHIEGAYKLGAHAIRASDPPLAEAIDAHARKAGEAWAKWVESEPRVKAFLERMMVGTPLGEVIAVHVGIGFSYFLARSALERARRDELAAELERQREEARAAGFEPDAAFAGA